MTLDYKKLMATRSKDQECTWTDRETMLYALSVGFGRDPLDAEELPYVFEGAGLRTIPTMCAVLNGGVRQG